MNADFISAIQELGKEKGIDPELLFQAVDDALRLHRKTLAVLLPKMLSSLLYSVSVRQSADRYMNASKAVPTISLPVLSSAWKTKTFISIWARLKLC